MATSSTPAPVRRTLLAMAALVVSGTAVGAVKPAMARPGSRPQVRSAAVFKAGGHLALLAAAEPERRAKEVPETETPCESLLDDDLPFDAENYLEDYVAARRRGANPCAAHSGPPTTTAPSGGGKSETASDAGDEAGGEVVDPAPAASGEDPGLAEVSAPQHVARAEAEAFQARDAMARAEARIRAGRVARASAAALAQEPGESADLGASAAQAASRELSAAAPVELLDRGALAAEMADAAARNAAHDKAAKSAEAQELARSGTAARAAGISRVKPHPEMHIHGGPKLSGAFGKFSASADQEERERAAAEARARAGDSQGTRAPDARGSAAVPAAQGEGQGPETA